MASPLQIRDVPEEARRVLKARAAARGQSLNRYLLDIIDREVARPTVAEVLARAARRAERGASSALAAVEDGRRERDDQLAGCSYRRQVPPRAASTRRARYTSRAM